MREAFTSHFVTAEGISTALSFIFWIKTFSELNYIPKGYHSYIVIDSLINKISPRFAGYTLALFQVIQLAFYLEFFYYYFKR
jgi:hypothetical protein